jgi:uncharacterized membrane protein (DUF485 family)
MYHLERSPADRNALEETSQLPILFARSDLNKATAPPAPDFGRIQHSPEFVSLRRRLRRFVFPLSLLFFAWYMTYVLLAAYAHDFMSVKVAGEVNVAIVLGLSQFATTVLITAVYVRFANRTLDPRAAEIRRLAGMADR